MRFFEELSPNERKAIMIRDWCTWGFISVQMYIAYEFGSITFDELKEEALRKYLLSKLL
jgi:hypothetical protein